MDEARADSQPENVLWQAFSHLTHHKWDTVGGFVDAVKCQADDPSDYDEPNVMWAAGVVTGAMKFDRLGTEVEQEMRDYYAAHGAPGTDNFSWPEPEPEPALTVPREFVHSMESCAVVANTAGDGFTFTDSAVRGTEYPCGCVRYADPDRDGLRANYCDEAWKLYQEYRTEYLLQPRDDPSFEMATEAFRKHTEDQYGDHYYPCGCVKYGAPTIRDDHCEKATSLWNHWQRLDHAPGHWDSARRAEKLYEEHFTDQHEEVPA